MADLFISDNLMPGIKPDIRYPIGLYFRYPAFSGYIQSLNSQNIQKIMARPLYGGGGVKAGPLRKILLFSDDH